MPTFAETSTASLDAVRSAARSLPTDVSFATALSDDELLATQRELAAARRELDACASLVAGEVAHRSRRDLGYRGLAQREGFRTPEALVQHITGSTARDASTLVSVGTLVHDAQAPTDGSAPPPSEPWMTEVGAAVSAGTITVDAARAIRAGLGAPTVDAEGLGVTSDDLAQAANRLVREASTSPSGEPGLHADRLLQRAREARDELDAAGIADRERLIHEQRSIRRVRRENGLHRYIIDPDIESAAFWDQVYDKLTSPRRGGPRFVDDEAAAWADDIATDTRTTGQYVHDALTELLRIGTRFDWSRADKTAKRRIIGSRMPAVRVLVGVESLATRTGHGRIEGSDIPVSIETIERIACTSGTVAITFDENDQVLNLGREQRLFSPAQRVALAARDGGCMAGDCDKPPDWTEAHHIEHWKRDDGETNIADGILLCRFHHLLVHNNHWEIVRADGVYWLIPPPEVDPEQRPRRMRSKSAALRDLRSSRAAG